MLLVGVCGGVGVVAAGCGVCDVVVGVGLVFWGLLVFGVGSGVGVLL